MTLIPRATEPSRGATLVLAAALLLAGCVGQGLAVPPDPPPGAGPGFEAHIHTIDRATRARMMGSSWHAGCPVRIRDLRLVELSYRTFDGGVRTGRLIVHEKVARAIVRVFEELFRREFPIRRMKLVDAYGGDDNASMAANNTSAFNCRFRAGSPGVWSQHAYGRAIDINPVQNPFLTGSGVYPPAGEAYVDRSNRRPGMIHHGDRVWRAFASIGWEWGGDWSTPDYQHFSRNGR